MVHRFFSSFLLSLSSLGNNVVSVWDEERKGVELHARVWNSCWTKKERIFFFFFFWKEKIVIKFFDSSELWSSGEKLKYLSRCSISVMLLRIKEKYEEKDTKNREQGFFYRETIYGPVNRPSWKADRGVPSEFDKEEHPYVVSLTLSNQCDLSLNK